MSDVTIPILDKDALIAQLQAALAARDTLIEALRLQLAQLRRQSFGQSSEKLTVQIEQLELSLEELEGEATLADIGKTVTQPSPRQPAVRSLPEHLQREERRIEPECGSCTCPDCGGDLRPLGQDSDEMLDALPVQWRVIRHVRPKYSCRGCEKIVQAPVPVKAITRGKASFATLAHIVVSKFDHHLPLYRQAEMMAAQGMDIDRSTLAGWAGQAARLLDPIVTRIREEGLKAAKLHTDDTPVPMLVTGKAKPCKPSYGFMPPMTGHRALHHRPWSGINLPLIAAVFIRRRNSKILPACCKPMAMPDMKSSTGTSGSKRRPRALASTWASTVSFIPDGSSISIRLLTAGVAAGNAATSHICTSAKLGGPSWRMPVSSPDMA